MARVFHRKARKDYPQAKIKKGDMYYFAKIKTGPYSSRTIRQLQPIKRSQLTSSDFLAQFYDLQDRLQDITSLSELESELQGIADDARQLGEEQTEKLQNMPEQLQEADSGQMLTERAEAMEAWASSLEAAMSTAAEKLSEYEANQNAWDDYDTAQEAFEASEGEEEPEEPDEGRMEESDLIQDVLDEVEEPSV